MNVQRMLKEIGVGFLHFTHHGFTYGPQGRMLLKNLEGLWFLHCITMPRYNIFLTESQLIHDTLTLLKDNNMDNIPFGLATSENSKTMWNQMLLPTGYKAMLHKIVKVITVSDASMSKDLFHKKQRERKVWWRKFSQCPSRFILTEEKRIRSYEIVEIQAEFPFGCITVETLTHQADTRKFFNQSKSNNDNDASGMRIIEHIVSLDWGCLTLLCDGYKFEESDTKVYIHPKLSPYKVAFLITNSGNRTDPHIKDLNRLVLYLNNILKEKGLGTILTSTRQVIEKCLVPFVITVDRTSLKDGIIHVTDRSTTLTTGVHITDLAKYIASQC